MSLTEQSLVRSAYRINICVFNMELLLAVGFPDLQH